MGIIINRNKIVNWENHLAFFPLCDSWWVWYSCSCGSFYANLPNFIKKYASASIFMPPVLVLHSVPQECNRGNPTGDHFTRCSVTPTCSHGIGPSTLKTCFMQSHSLEARKLKCPCTYTLWCNIFSAVPPAKSFLNCCWVRCSPE